MVSRSFSENKRFNGKLGKSAVFFNQRFVYRTPEKLTCV